MKNKMANGQGKLIKTSTHSLIYEGKWLKNLYHGQGTLFNQNKTELDSPFDYKDFSLLKNNWVSYEGDFYKGKFEGIGKLLLTNGEKYLGKFWKGSVHKTGNFRRKNGLNVAGIWENGILKYQI